jgi:collagenase-like PrtC family protease
MNKPCELVCPAGNLPALKAAVENGADAVYLGLADDTNARHFAGLNFTAKNLPGAVAHARERGVRVLFAVNTYPQQQSLPRWRKAVDAAAHAGVDALIACDPAVLAYAQSEYPGMHRHLSVQASATNIDALRFYVEEFAIRRAVLPRVLSLAQVEAIAQKAPCEIEVFGFGSLCIMAEGRCYLSSWLTGESPNTCGACSPARSVSWTHTPTALESRLAGVLIDAFDADEKAGYPTLCKGRFQVDGRLYHALEEPVSLNTLALLPQLLATGVRAVKIEGRQRAPAYVAQVTRAWRAAIDSAAADPANYRVQPAWEHALAELSEGAQTTLGAYHRAWQ